MSCKKMCKLLLGCGKKKLPYTPPVTPVVHYPPMPIRVHVGKKLNRYTSPVLDIHETLSSPGIVKQ